ncbi:MAG: DUF6503 family protein [Cyclobacteriaceae bacterium]
MKKLAFILLVFPAILSAQTPEEVLQKAVKYHDPMGEWKSLKATFIFSETRPDGEDRKTILELDNSKNWHKINRNDEEIYEVNSQGKVRIVKGDGSEDRAKTLRSYYVFLWGLPMKLMRANTPIQPKVLSQKIDGLDCHGVVVRYDEETYTFFFAKENYRMLAYQFYRNDDSGFGELIKLKGELMVGSMKIPQERSWYELPENKYLGSDIIAEAK